MLIKAKELKEVCAKILTAVDSSNKSELADTLELKVVSGTLLLSVTNREYFVSVKFPIGAEEVFHATVNAQLFLKLIPQLTTEDVELTIKNNSLNIKSNGTYKLPLVFEGDKLLELSPIVINNKTVEMGMGKEILSSILQYNSKELLNGIAVKPVQRMYYIDENGAITFTSGACVNSFTLEKPVKVLLSNKVVKLFKLFKESDVKFSLGYDALSDDIIQTKVSFESDDVILTAITSCDDTLLNSVPVQAIRQRANTVYPYSVVFHKDTLMQAINRLLLFSGSKRKGVDESKAYSKFQFSKEFVKFWDVKNESNEELHYVNGSNILEDYEMVIDLINLKTTLEGYSEEYITLSFGDNTAVVLSRNNIKNVIPEARLITANGE